MKKLYMIGGPMGVGKTSVCQQLKLRLDNCVFLDGDNCWDSNPIIVNDETKKMVLENISFLLNQYINCSVYDKIIFCWVMDKQNIIDSILSNLTINNINIKKISLVCNEETLTKRLEKDINKNLRLSDIIKRSIERIPLYSNLDTIKIITDNKSIEEVVENIISLE